MFRNGKTRENNELKTRAERLEAELQARTAELSQAQATNQALSGECTRLKTRIDAFGSLFDRLKLYSESAMKVQGSLASLALAMKDEREQSVKATSSLGSNLQVIERISSNLVEMAERTNSTAIKVDHLNERSGQIGGIVQLIKEIADQTNLLALNAAIEAARAGEQGRGFAVVADEVRKLSERTATSTTDIARIVQVIQASTSQAAESMVRAKDEVSQGVSLGEKMGRVLQEIDRSVHVFTDMLQQIATATEEQSAVGTEISANIETVANITASTANDIERARNAMLDLASSSRTLHEAVGQFTLAGAGA